MWLNSLDFEKDILFAERQLLAFSGIFFDNEEEKRKFSKFLAENRIIKAWVIDKNFDLGFFLESYFHYKFYRYWTEKIEYKEAIESAEKYFSYHKLLTIFAPAYENIDLLEEQVKQAEKEIWPLTADIDGFNRLCEFYFQWLEGFFEEKVSEKDRLANIDRLNRQQLSKLWLDIEVQGRKLILYYRYRHEFELVDNFEFAVIYWILKKYIKWWYSPLFNEIAIVSRQKDMWPRKLIKQIDEDYSYIGVSWENFKKLNIWWNFLYLGMWNAKESEELASIPIINNAIDLFEEKKPKQYVKWNFAYTWDDPISVQDTRFKRINWVEGNIYLLMKEILKSVQNLERVLLSN